MYKLIASIERNQKSGIIKPEDIRRISVMGAPVTSDMEDPPQINLDCCVIDEKGIAFRMPNRVEKMVNSIEWRLYLQALKAGYMEIVTMRLEADYFVIEPRYTEKLKEDWQKLIDLIQKNGGSLQEAVNENERRIETEIRRIKTETGIETENSIDSKGADFARNQTQLLNKNNDLYRAFVLLLANETIQRNSKELADDQAMEVEIRELGQTISAGQAAACRAGHVVKLYPRTQTNSYGDSKNIFFESVAAEIATVEIEKGDGSCSLLEILLGFLVLVEDPRR